MISHVEALETIDRLIASGAGEELIGVVRRIEDMESSGEVSGGLCYAAGYALYMMPSGRPEREECGGWFLKSLIREPGHRGALLYLAYVAMDRHDWETALKLLFALPLEHFSDVPEWADRVVEAQVFALVQSGDWKTALTQLDWFDHRLKEDPDCGIIMINFMRLLDSPPPEIPAAREVVEKVRRIVRIEAGSADEETGA